MDRNEIKQKLQEVKKGCGHKFQKDSLVYVLTFGMSGKPKETRDCKEYELCDRCEKLRNKYLQMLINKRRIMKCKKCSGLSFSFRWDYNEDDEIGLYMCHDGIGFQLENSIIRCDKCGKESQYDEEEFLTTEVLELNGKVTK